MPGAAVILAATLVLTNGKIWTGNGFAKSVVIDGNRIVGVDVEQPLLSAPAQTGVSAPRVIDLHGRLAVPGFIDNHAHFVDGGFQLSRVQLRDAATPEEFARRIAAHARLIGPGQWVVDGAWDEQLWQPYRLPTRQMIDAVTPDNPVFVTRLDGHMSLANGIALQRAGITRDTPDPPGGTIVRDSSGEPTGLLKDTAMDAVFAQIPPSSPEERVRAAAAALGEAARFGVTSICDMSGSNAYEDLRAYQR